MKKQTKPEVRRSDRNPIITVDNVKPSGPGWKVEYVMNAGCHRVGEDVLLLLRIRTRIFSWLPTIRKRPGRYCSAGWRRTIRSTISAIAGLCCAVTKAGRKFCVC